MIVYANQHQSKLYRLSLFEGAFWHVGHSFLQQPVPANKHSKPLTQMHVLLEFIKHLPMMRISMRKQPVKSPSYRIQRFSLGNRDS